MSKKVTIHYCDEEEILFVMVNDLEKVNSKKWSWKEVQEGELDD